MEQREEDFIEHLFTCSTHDFIMFFTDDGRVYVEKVYELPEMGRAAKGRSIANFLQLRPEEKIAALIHRRIPVVEAAKFKLALEEKALTVEMPEETFYLEGIQVAKRGISMDLQKFFPDVACARFVETFKAEPKPESKPQA